MRATLKKRRTEPRLNAKRRIIVKSQINDLATTAERKYKVFKQDSSGSVQQLLTQIEDQIEESVQLVKETYDGIQASFERAYKQNPTRMVASAFTAGVLVGMTFAKLTHPKK
jgi:ElaB/YqjD/DUF883 family membrane-anchored ribosome-binding protein